jgi:hypothetical protein
MLPQSRFPSGDRSRSVFANRMPAAESPDSNARPRRCVSDHRRRLRPGEQPLTPSAWANSIDAVMPVRAPPARISRRTHDCEATDRSADRTCSVMNVATGALERRARGIRVGLVVADASPPATLLDPNLRRAGMCPAG